MTASAVGELPAGAAARSGNRTATITPRRLARSPPTRAGARHIQIFHIPVPPDRFAPVGRLPARKSEVEIRNTAVGAVFARAHRPTAVHCAISPFNKIVGLVLLPDQVGPDGERKNQKCISKQWRSPRRRSHSKPLQAGHQIQNNQRAGQRGCELADAQHQDETRPKKSRFPLSVLRISRVASAHVASAVSRWMALPDCSRCRLSRVALSVILGSAIPIA